MYFYRLTYIALSTYILSFSANADTDTSRDTAQTYINEYNGLNQAKLELEAYEFTKLGKLTTKLASGNWIMKLGIQGPIDDDINKTGTFADLDGLKGGTKVSFGANYLFFNKNSLENIVAVGYSNCEKSLLIKRSRILDKIKSCKEKHKEDVEKLENDEKKREAYEVMCKDVYTEERKLPKSCNHNKYSNSVRKEISEIDLSIHMLGIEVNAGSKKLEWADKNTLSTESGTKSSYSAALQYGFINNNYNRLNIGFRYEKLWNEEDSQSFCIANSTITGAIDCYDDIAIGQPIRSIARVSYIEWKQYLGSSDKYAFSTRFSHDSVTDVTGIDIPIYLYQSEKTSNLQGGVRLGWVSDKKPSDNIKNDDEVLFSIFFNVGFSISD